MRLRKDHFVQVKIRVSPDLKDAFQKACEQNDTDVSKELRRAMRAYVSSSYTPPLPLDFPED
jgi:hypothetical protein